MSPFVFPDPVEVPLAYRSDVASLLRRCRADVPHARRVTGHALCLLRATAGAFADPGAQDRYAAELALGAALHDIGHFVAQRGHHRHSRYLIRHAEETARWPAALRDRVAALAFTHRNKPRPDWLRRVFEGDADGMRLGALLRLADGLDRRHAPGVDIVSCEERKAAWRLAVRGLAAADGERLLRNKADLFALAFGAELRLVPVGPP